MDRFCAFGRLGRFIGGLALAATAALAGADEVAAQTPGGPKGTPQATGAPQGARNQVRIPGTAINFHEAGPKEGWFVLGPGVKAHWVSEINGLGPWSGHPTVEVIIEAGLSGHPTQDERLLMQFPPNLFQIPQEERALVLAFHPYGLSYLSPFNGSELPTLCEERNWILVAPLGLTQTNFATVQSQETLDITLELIFHLLQFNRQRVYTVGFSMGGLNAVSYAMRKQDPTGLRVAGVVNHTGTMDAILDYETGGPGLKEVLEDDLHFNGSPTEEFFAWERINPTRLTPGNIVDPLRAPVTNLIDVPFYLHLNTQDPNADLVAMTYALHTHLLGLGVDVHLDTVNAGNTHAWSTMDMAEALDFIDGGLAPGEAPENGPVLELFADREDAYRLSEVVSIEPDQVARYKIVVQTPLVNSFAVQAVDGVRELSLDLAPMLVNTAEVLSMTTWAVDGKPVTYNLQGYTAAPSTITVNGVPPVSSSFDAASGTLTVTPTVDGSFAVVQVIP